MSGALYVAGGLDGSGQPTGLLEAYDPTAKSWMTLTPMPIARSGAGAAMIDGRLLVVGGQTSAGNFLSELHIYDPATDVWSTATTMATARADLGVAAVGSSLYAVGGRNAAGTLRLTQVFTSGLSSAGLSMSR